MADTETLAVRLPQSLAKALLYASRQEQISKSELVRRAVAAHLGRIRRDANQGPSLLDQAGDLVGCFHGGPKDLASNPRHPAGFGNV